VHAAESPRAVLVLGHGAGGGVGAPDLVATRDAALAEGISVVLVEQPYRVAGRRSPPAATTLDAAWLETLDRLRSHGVAGPPLLTGGRSSGARVACRTAAETGAVGVVCLAFPLRPPSRSGPERPSRLPELDGVRVPTLVVQGESDPFGLPPSRPGRSVVLVPGDHGLRRSSAAVSDAVRAWLGGQAPTWPPPMSA